jgi:hypothetical protein
VSMSADQKRYQAQEDLRTLQSAKAIQGDKGRVAAASKEAQSQMKALQAHTQPKSIPKPVAKRPTAKKGK